MSSSNYRFTLNVQEEQSQVSLPVILGDTNRELYISISDGGKPFIIEEGSIATFVGKKADDNVITTSCIIEGSSVVRYDFTEQTSSCPGIVDCEIRLYNKDGKLIASPRFIMVVDERVIVDGDIVSENWITTLDEVYGSEAQRRDAETKRVAAEWNRVTAEKKRANDETARVTAENERAEAENKRVSTFNASEGERQKTFSSNENNRQSIFALNEANRQDSYETFEESRETKYAKAEKARDESCATAEGSRDSRYSEAESTRNSRYSEAERARNSTFESNETSRDVAEGKRVTAENLRVSAENSRVYDEGSRARAESARATAETLREIAETSRANFEDSRNNAENWRVKDENSRNTYEQARRDAEKTRVSAESTRASNEEARMSAEEGRAEAETARELRLNAVEKKVEGCTNAIKATASGEFVRIDGVSSNEHTIKCKVKSDSSIDLTSVKVTRRGKNLVIPIYTENTEISGVTITPNIDNSLTFNGNATDKVICRVIDTSANRFTLKKGTYTFSFADKLPANLYCIIEEYANGEWVGQIANIKEGESSKTFTVDHELDLSVYIRITQGTTLTNYTVKPMLESGDIATEYEAPVKATTHTPLSDGTVEGIKSLAPTMTLFTDTKGVEIEVEYNQDINVLLDYMKASLRAILDIQNSFIGGES